MPKQEGRSCIASIDPISFPAETLDPFLFCVYHKDDYPAGDGKLQAPRQGNGADFNPSAPYRMYHGDRIPGFPQHPHRGFETITATLEGVIDHADSHGNSGRYGGGDLQWMTAGSGVQHSEMFPLVYTEQPNMCRFFQIWLNLPAAGKFSKPAFVMHWNEEVPRYHEAGATVTVWAGELGDKKGLPPPPDSWAINPDSDLAVWHIRLEPAGTLIIPAAKGGASTNRVVYVVEGTAGVSGKQVPRLNRVVLRAEQAVELRNTHSEATELLLLQGRPIGEPVAKHGPFVMNTQQEIQQAFSDYRRTQFGGWPWPSHETGPTFGTRGRFALLDQKEELPPSFRPMRVKLKGLKDEAFNGRLGTRGAYDMNSGRFVVTLDSDEKEVSLKEANLEAAD